MLLSMADGLCRREGGYTPDHRNINPDQSCRPDQITRTFRSKYVSPAGDKGDGEKRKPERLEAGLEEEVVV